METIIEKDITKAIAFLKSNELVAIPTETVYGLAANALEKDAVLKIFKAKDRPSFDPLIVHFPTIDNVELYANDIPSKAYDLMQAFWPGPLTIVLPKNRIIPDIVTSGLNTVGLRVPNHPLTLTLLEQCKFPLAAPSANPFGYISPTTAQHVYDQLNGKIPYILDGGNCGVGVESTIVGFEDEQAFIYRLGGIAIEEIKKIIPNIILQINSSSDPKAPGMLKSHYAPSKPLFIGDINQLIQDNINKKYAILSFGKTNFDRLDNVYNLSISGDYFEAAFNLFAFLRVIDTKKDIEIILTSLLPNESLGRAINDRLKRAAVNNIIDY